MALRFYGVWGCFEPMVQRQAKGRHYLSAVRGKEWKEVGIVEVISEAVGGFMLAFFAFSRGWIDSQSASEICLECVGCAILIPIVAFILRVLIVAPAELVKESSESRNKDET